MQTNLAKITPPCVTHVKLLPHDGLAQDVRYSREPRAISAMEANTKALIFLHEMATSRECTMPPANLTDRETERAGNRLTESIYFPRCPLTLIGEKKSS